jgi:hypothetical protein
VADFDATVTATTATVPPTFAQFPHLFGFVPDPDATNSAAMFASLSAPAVVQMQPVAPAPDLAPMNHEQGLIVTTLNLYAILILG